MRRPALAAFDRPMRDADIASNGTEGWRRSACQQHASPRDPTRRFRPETCNRTELRKVLILDHQLDRPPWHGHSILPLLESPNDGISTSSPTGLPPK